MPISAVAAGVAIAGTVANTAINASKGGGAATGGGASTGGSGIQANEQKFYGSDASNPYYGVHVGTTPMSGKQAPSAQEMPINGKGTQGRTSSARDTPTQADGVNDARQDTNNEWADRLSKYLDYNTRALG